MYPQANERSKQTVLDFKCEKILPIIEKTTALSPLVKKSGVVGNKILEPTIACETPEKTVEPVLKKSQEDQVQLPKQVIAESFDHLNCSLNLLGLRKKSPTFENVCTQMEILTKRNFSYRHLAQMKYILPEAIQIDKILTHDKKTMSMKPGMKISLLFAAVDGHSEISDFVALSKVFSSRLYSFFTTHPEASDVPEVILPDPFNQRSPDIVPDESPEDQEDAQPNSFETDNFSGIIGSNPRIRRYFSQNPVTDKKEKVDILSAAAIPTVNNLDQDCQSDRLEELGDRISILHTQSQEDTLQLLGNGTPDTPLAKPSSVGSCIAIETPSPLIPRRSASSSDIPHKNITSHRLTQSCQPAKRSLDFFQSKDDESAFDSIENEEKQIGESTCVATSHHLVDRVDVIYKIFMCADFSPITKEELVHKMIMHCLDVEKEGVIEEQLELLESRVPDWIYKKLLFSGDYGYEINKVKDLDQVRASLSF